MLNVRIRFRSKTNAKACIHAQRKLLGDYRAHLHMHTCNIACLYTPCLIYNQLISPMMQWRIWIRDFWDCNFQTFTPCMSGLHVAVFYNSAPVHALLHGIQVTTAPLLIPHQFFPNFDWTGIGIASYILYIPARDSIQKRPP